LLTSEQNLCEMALVKNAARNGAVCYHHDSKEFFFYFFVSFFPKVPRSIRRGKKLISIQTKGREFAVVSSPINYDFLRIRWSSAICRSFGTFRTASANQVQNLGNAFLPSSLFRPCILSP